MVVEKEVVKIVEVPGQTVVVEKEVVKTVEVPGKTYVTDPTTGKAVEAPRYGGTFTYAVNFAEKGNIDYWFGNLFGHLVVPGVLEKPSIANWAINRNE